MQQRREVLRSPDCHFVVRFIGPNCDRDIVDGFVNFQPHKHDLGIVGVVLSQLLLGYSRSELALAAKTAIQLPGSILPLLLVITSVSVLCQDAKVRSWFESRHRLHHNGQRFLANGLCLLGCPYKVMSGPHARCGA